MALSPPEVNLINPAFIATRSTHIVNMGADIVDKINTPGFTGSATSYAAPIGAIDAQTARLTGTDSVTTTYKAFLAALKAALI